MPSIDWSKAALQSAGDTGEQLSGVPSDMTQLAMMAGYRPNLYANPVQQAQNMAQYQIMMKNIMDQQLGGPNGAAARMAPGNPMMAMPVNYQNFYNTMAGLYTNPVWSQSMPGGGPAAGGPGGFQFGSPTSAMSPGMAGLVQGLAQAQSNQTPSSASMAGSMGPSVMNNGAGLGASGGVGALSSGGPNGASPVTVNTAGTGAPSAIARIARLQGTNALPQGVDPNNLADVLLNKFLDSIDPQGSNPATQSQPALPSGQSSGGSQGGASPLAALPLGLGNLFR